jgi:hypothetical protein
MTRQYSESFKTSVTEILHQEPRPSIFFDKYFISFNVLGSYFVYAYDNISAEGCLMSLNMLSLAVGQQVNTN